MTTDSNSVVPTVLLVDDEQDIRDLARLILEKSGLKVSEAVDGPQALAQYAELNPPPTPSVVVLDNRMPGLTGIQVAEKMLSIYPDQVILLFSAFLDNETTAAAIAVGVTTCVSKSDVRRLPEIIRSLIPAA
jgi:CheY-like chemotaxis protein